MDEIKRESFIFYASFYEAIEELNDKKQLNLFKAITKLALKNEEIELKGEEKRLFSLIKPQILANLKRYNDGQKGGRPKREKNEEIKEEKKTSGFLKTETDGYENKKPNYNENVNKNVNDNVNDNVNENENGSEEKNKKTTNQNSKKPDPFLNNSICEKFVNEYEKVFSNRPTLLNQHRQKILELNSEIEDFTDTLPDALKNLKAIDFADINFQPDYIWLLKDDNYLKAFNNVFKKKEKKDYFDGVKEIDGWSF